MSRGIGELDAIQHLIPEWVAVILALLTQLGDIWFLATLFALLYWYNTPNQDDIAALAGVWLAGMGLYKGLKEIFGFPRPEQPLLDAELLPWMIQPIYEATAFASGYGFPSGHAVNTTIVYFGLAYLLRTSTPRKRFTVAALIVSTVCFTRVALGVHYVIDVVVGVAVGVLLLTAARALMTRRPADQATISFGLAVVFAGFFLVTSDLDPDAIFVLGASLGAFAGWQLIMLGRQLVELSRPSLAVRPIIIRGGGAIVALSPLVGALEYFPIITVYTAGGAVGLVTSGIVIVPVMRYSDRARRVGIAVKFWLRMGVVGLRLALRPETLRRAIELVRTFSAAVVRWLRTRWRYIRSEDQ